MNRPPRGASACAPRTLRCLPMTSAERERAGGIVLAAVEGCRFPVSFTTLRGAVYRAVGEVGDAALLR